MPWLNEENLLKLAFRNNEIVSIEEVASGISCNCFCPQCNQPLVAKNQGKRKAYHFAHIANYKCQGAVESAIHFLAKKILFEKKVLFIPSVMSRLN
jgi:competence CoiA-like predicted nuclease